MADLRFADLLEPGDLVVVAQGTGEPTGLLSTLIAQRHELPADIEVFVGLSHSGVLLDPGVRDLRLTSFGAMGVLGRLAATGDLAVIPCHFADVPRLLRIRARGRLVLLVHVTPPDAGGHHSLGTAVDYTYELLDSADVVVAEVNDQLPVTGAPTVHASRIDAQLVTSRPVQVVEDVEATATQRRIAEHVATLVPDGATIQLGVGAVASVVGSALRARRGLRVHSTLVGNWLLGLAEAGALSAESDAVMISEAAGSPKLYEYILSAGVRIRPVGEVTRPDVIGTVERLVAMNSALEVDLSGQVNAEALESGYVAGIGGQPDFMRAAQRSPGGRSIVMLPATAMRGTQSRIVRHLQRDAVTTSRAAVDFVVTEFGVADLRGRDLQQRIAALCEIAAPDHREALRDA